MDNVSGQVVPKSTHTVVVNIDSVVLNNAMDKYWTEVKDRLSPEIIKKVTKGGFREVKRERVVKVAGGLSKFYRPVLLDAVVQYMKTQERQVLAFDEINLTPSIGSDAVIQATVYLEPQITWKKVPGSTDGPALEVKIPKVDPDLLTKIVSAEIERGRDKHSVLVPTEAAADRGMVVVVDCQSTIGGQVWADGTFYNNKWLLDDNTIKLPEIVNQMVGMIKGQIKTFKVTLNEKFDKLNGTEIEMAVRLNEVCVRTQPDIDDDLAISMGYTSLSEWRAQTHNRYDQILSQERQELIGNSILSLFLNPDVLDVEPIPQVWLFNKAHEIYNQQRDQVKTEEELLAKFKDVKTFEGLSVNTKNELLALFAERAAQMLVEDLVFRSYGKMVGVAGDTTLENVAQYATEVRKYLLEKVQVIEVEQNKE
jgi:FKBP-type peptidyl-prolyl cis-trans isomerase (trigger factor)